MVLSCCTSVPLAVIYVLQRFRAFSLVFHQLFPSFVVLSWGWYVKHVVHMKLAMLHSLRDWAAGIGCDLPVL